jgi:hypothetical protein
MGIYIYHGISFGYVIVRPCKGVTIYVINKTCLDVLKIRFVDCYL